MNEPELVRLRTLTRQAVVRVAAEYAPEPWVRRALMDLPDDAPIVLGLYALPDPSRDEERPAIAIGLVERRKPGRPPGQAVVFVLWDHAAGAGGRWRCQTRTDGSIPAQQYRGDPNGPPGPVNGDYPWLYPGGTEDAVADGLTALRRRRVPRREAAHP